MPNRVTCLTATMSLLLAWQAATPAGKTAPQTSPRKTSAFTDQVASQLLDQVGAGLAEHSSRRVLAAFDLTKMNDGPLFRQQIASFLAQTGNIQVHYNLLEVSMEGEQGVATVQMEMEADPREGNSLPLRKQAQLRLVAASSADGWKFIDVQPRSFFSTQ